MTYDDHSELVDVSAPVTMMRAALHILGTIPVMISRPYSQHFVTERFSYLSCASLIVLVLFSGATIGSKGTPGQTNILLSYTRLFSDSEKVIQSPRYPIDFND